MSAVTPARADRNKWIGAGRTSTPVHLLPEVPEIPHINQSEPIDDVKENQWVIEKASRDV